MIVPAFGPHNDCCTYCSIDDIMSGNLEQRCGKPAVKYYMWVLNGRYFARCEKHVSFPADRAAEREEVTWDEYLVHLVHDS